MSYKFQRLREKIRQAIASGELCGKLPGERALARRFHVNAKTLSKALTDLAAEGVLDRSIGRGTYVKGSAPATAAPAAGRWLVLCDAGRARGDGGGGERTLTDAFVEHLRRSDIEVQTATDPKDMRPSFLNGFSAVIDLAPATPEQLLRDLVVRGLPVIAVGREARTYSTHAVLPDVALGAARLGREMLLAGLRHLAAVEEPGETTVAQALRRAASAFGGDVTVDASSAGAGDITALLDGGAHGIVCASPELADRVRHELERLGSTVPGRVSLAAVGSTCAHGDEPCSGYFVDCAQLCDAVIGLLRDAPPRPTTLWLAGKFVDLGTLAPPGGSGDDADADGRSHSKAELTHAHAHSHAAAAGPAVARASGAMN